MLKAVLAAAVAGLVAGTWFAWIFEDPEDSQTPLRALRSAEHAEV